MACKRPPLSSGDPRLSARQAPRPLPQIDELVDARRAVRVRIAGEFRFVPVTLPSRLPDALGTAAGLPEIFLAVTTRCGKLWCRYAATAHCAFHGAGICRTLRLGAFRRGFRAARSARGKLLEESGRAGSTRNGAIPKFSKIRARAWRGFGAKLEPGGAAHVRCGPRGPEGVSTRRRGAYALLHAVENLQGAALLASEVEREILPARLARLPLRRSRRRTPAAEGGVGLGEQAAIAMDAWLYTSPCGPRSAAGESRKEQVSLSEKKPKDSGRAGQVGASFFGSIHAAIGGGFPGDTRDELWNRRGPARDQRYVLLRCAICRALATEAVTQFQRVTGHRVRSAPKVA